MNDVTFIRLLAEVLGLELKVRNEFEYLFDFLAFFEHFEHFEDSLKLLKVL